MRPNTLRIEGNGNQVKIRDIVCRMSDVTEEAVMHDLDKSEIKTVCKEILTAFQGVVSWNWDNRFGTVLAEFSVDKKDRVHAILNRYFTIGWDISNIDKAPTIVRAIDKHLGGIRSGQLLLNTDPNQDAFVFCAWWPWGDGHSISMRIAPFDKRLSDSEEAELIKQLKGWAGI